MSTQNDGGPAFPCPGQSEHWGMSLRDHYAGLAMQAQVTTDMVPGEACEALAEAAARAGQDPVYRLALNSYEIADAMIRARNANLALQQG